ncbi:hypothetical protein Ddc_08622 [Ditylenchus destructor]|nr:hypothetical protein Ddc_08622 [Ditylenchus destructor]
MSAVKLWQLQRQNFEPTQTLVAYPDGNVGDPARNAHKRNAEAVSEEAMLISWTSSSHSLDSGLSYATYSSTPPVEQTIFEGDDSDSECSVKSAPAGYFSAVSSETAFVQCGKNYFSVWQIGDQCLAPFTDYNVSQFIYYIRFCIF